MLNNDSILTWFVIDASGSMCDDDYPPSRIRAACDASLAYVENLAGRGGGSHQGAVIAFNSDGKLVLPPTDIVRVKVFKKAIGGLDADGGTDFVEGLKPILDALNGVESRGFFSWLFDSPAPVTVDSGISHRVVFLSDGHSCREKAAESSAKALKGAGVVIETVGIGGSPADVDEDLLKAMASLDPHGQPRYRFIGDRQALLQEFEAKAAQLKVC